MKFPFLGALFLCDATLIKCISSAKCVAALGLLKRSALSHTFVWKLRIAVNLFTPIVEALTASESVQSIHSQQKRSCSASSRWVAKGVDGTNVFVKADLCGCSTPAGLFENGQGYSPRKTCPSLFRFVVK